jgi:hypothetical protein
MSSPDKSYIGHRERFLTRYQKFRLGAMLARFDNSQNVKLFERRQQRDAGRFLTEIVESETYDLKDFSYPPPE